MSEHLLPDFIRFLHFGAMALSLGLALFADLRFFGRLTQPVSAEDMVLLERVHVTIARALLLMWLSGLGLIWLRTGFDPALMTPKLIAKLIVVSVLTANSVLIGRAALPILRRAVGYSISDIRFGYRIRLMIIGSISTASWASALILGVFSDLKPMGVEQLVNILGPVYGLCLSGGVFLALTAPAAAYVLRHTRVAKDPYDRVRARHVNAR